MGSSPSEKGVTNMKRDRTRWNWGGDWNEKFQVKLMDGWMDGWIDRQIDGYKHIMY